jgi:SAM-dependent methyltransferase
MRGTMDADPRLQRSMNLWGRIGEQLRAPSGTSGVLIGHLMDVANRVPIRSTINALAPGPLSRILEIGFGTGLAIRILLEAAPDCHVTGLDHSKAMIRAAAGRNRAAIAAGRVDLVHGKASRLPWPSETFDYVLAINVAYFFADAGSEMAEIHRVLRPGGKVALFVTERETMSAWRFAGAATHRTYDREALTDLCNSGGFCSTRISISEMPLPLGLKGLIATAGKSC